MRNGGHMRKIAVMFLWLFLPIVSNAAPNIAGVSGTLSGGNTITITGSEFGSKPQGPPLGWLNFDDPKAYRFGGDPVDATKWSIGYASNGSNTIQSTIKHNGNYALRSKFGSNEEASKITSPVYSDQKTLYVSWWDYFSSTFAWPQAVKANQQGFSADDPNNPDQFAPLLQYFSSPQYSGSCSSSSIWGDNLNNDGSGPADSIGGGYVPVKICKETWYHQEILYILGDVPGTDEAYFWSNGKLIRHATNQRIRGKSTRGFTGGNSSPSWFGGNYSGLGIDPPTVGYRYMDDFYVDGTQARVIATDNPGYRDSWKSVGASSYLLETQIPISWDNRSVRIIFNQGGFKSGQTIYLFVIDSAGGISNPMPVTVSGTTEFSLPTEAPSSPRNLSIQ